MPFSFLLFGSLSCRTTLHVFLECEQFERPNRDAKFDDDVRVDSGGVISSGKFRWYLLACVVSHDYPHYAPAPSGSFYHLLIGVVFD